MFKSLNLTKYFLKTNIPINNKDKNNIMNIIINMTFLLCLFVEFTKFLSTVSMDESSILFDGGEGIEALSSCFSP
jgi:hypothetical protein